MRVIIIGGGLGGLSLAQSLPAVSVEATVYERDPDPFARGQGYRIHLDPEADAVLKECLPPRVYQRYRDTSGETEGGHTFLLTEQLVEISRMSIADHYGEGPVTDAVVDRETFRQALSLDLPVRYGKSCTGVANLPDGRVRASFADGTDAVGDVVVGADGVGSAIRRQIHPKARVFDTGLRLIYGRTPLASLALPDYLARGFAIVMGGTQSNMAFGWYESRDRATGDYLMWAVVAREETFPPSLADAGGEALQKAAMAVTETWHPVLREVIALGAVPSLTYLRMRSSAPTPRWQPGRVTLLGDAAHAMFPAGSGTLVAMKDVRVLRNALRDAAAGTMPLAAALDRYETEMFSYAWEYVRSSYEMAERLGGIPWDQAT